MSLYVNGRRTAPVIGIGQGEPIEIDDELSLESENPVQNKVITARINELESYIEEMGSEFDGDIEALRQEIYDRFEELGSELDEHFASIDDRFEELGSEMDERFNDLEEDIDERFTTLEENIDNRFEDLEDELDEEFAEVHGQLEELEDTKVDKLDFLTALDMYELWYGVESSESSESSEQPGPHTLNVVIVPVTLLDEYDYMVDEQVLTLFTNKVCKVGYEDVDGMVMIPAVENSDGSHSFTAPDGVETVYVVLKGDANLDGTMTLADADLVFSYVHSGTAIDPLGKFAADINNSGDLIDSDAVIISFAVLNGTPLDW